MAGVALGDMDLHFAWQAWHLVTWTVTLRGRRGTYGNGLVLVARLVAACRRTLCVKRVALGHMDFHFAWQAWHLVTWTVTLRGMHATYGNGLVLVARLVAACRRTLCVARVALGDMDLHFAWQAWHLVTWTFTSRGRRGTYGNGLVLAWTFIL